ARRLTAAPSHHRTGAEPLRAAPVLAPLARPAVLTGMARPGALDVIDALEPDERARVRVDGRPGPGFECQAPLEQLAACAPPEEHPGQETVDEDRREQSRLAILAEDAHRPLGMSERPGRIGR